jgi:transposase-like protein
MNDLSKPIFHDEAKAREWLEKRLWANGPVCPKCGVIDQATLMEGKSHRHGLYQCNACREPFTVTVGTLYERSKVPLHKWLAATHLMMASKKGMSALQIGRLLGLSKKTAWFLCHRIRESLRETSPGLLGGGGQTVEADETYVGGKVRRLGRAYVGNKTPVVALVERGGRVRSRAIKKVTGKTLRQALNEHLDPSAHLMTDDLPAYRKPGARFASHQTVNHSADEYVRGNVHTNTIEGFFSIMKRGVHGTYHHVIPSPID